MRYGTVSRIGLAVVFAAGVAVFAPAVAGTAVASPVGQSTTVAHEQANALAGWVFVTRYTNNRQGAFDCAKDAANGQLDTGRLYECRTNGSSIELWKNV